MMDKDAIMDMVLQYGQKRALAGELYQMGQSAHTAADQAKFNKTAQTVNKDADWFYRRIQRELGE